MTGVSSYWMDRNCKRLYATVDGALSSASGATSITVLEKSSSSK